MNYAKIVLFLGMLFFGFGGFGTYALAFGQQDYQLFELLNDVGNASVEVAAVLAFLFMVTVLADLPRSPKYRYPRPLR